MTLRRFLPNLVKYPITTSQNQPFCSCVEQTGLVPLGPFRYGQCLSVFHVHSSLLSLSSIPVIGRRMPVKQSAVPDQVVAKPRPSSPETCHAGHLVHSYMAGSFL